jgi:hypothetical protein
MTTNKHNKLKVTKCDKRKGGNILVIDLCYFVENRSEYQLRNWVLKNNINIVA